MKSVSVLVIEDNQSDAFLMRSIMSASSVPIELTIAEDGESALQMLHNPGFAPDLIVTDLSLPGTSGEQFLKRYQGKSAPVVVFSSSASPSDAARALELGACEVVEKPVMLDDFAEALWKVVWKWTAGKAAQGK